MLSTVTWPWRRSLSESPGWPAKSAGRSKAGADLSISAEGRREGSPAKSRPRSSATTATKMTSGT